MITIFATPKRFSGLFDTLQHNAIASWRALGDDVQIILFGDDPGTAEAAAEYGCEHRPDVALSPKGTPMLDDMFHRAQAEAKHSLVCYANADIIFQDDLPDALRAVQSSLGQFLMVGRRTNLDVTERLTMSDEASRRWIRREAGLRGELFTPYGIDWFVFPRGQIMDFLPFPVGRPMWDNWLIYHMRKQMIPVVDATWAVQVVHQNHDYGHVKGGHKAVWYGEEAQKNKELLGPDFLPFSIDDATWQLDVNGLRRVLAPSRLLRHAVRGAALVPGLSRSVRVGRRLRSILAQRQ